METLLNSNIRKVLKTFCHITNSFCQYQIEKYMFFYYIKCNNTVTYTQLIFYVVCVCISQTRMFPERVVERNTGAKMCWGLNMMSNPFVILLQVTSAFQLGGYLLKQRGHCLTLGCQTVWTQSQAQLGSLLIKMPLSLIRIFGIEDAFRPMVPCSNLD